MTEIDGPQWPATAVTVLASWLIGSTDGYRYRAGSYISLLSNTLWKAWRLYDDAPALVALKVAVAMMNVRGAMNSRREVVSKAAWRSRY